MLQTHTPKPLSYELAPHTTEELELEALEMVELEDDKLVVVAVEAADELEEVDPELTAALEDPDELEATDALELAAVEEAAGVLTVLEEAVVTVLAALAALAALEEAPATVKLQGLLAPGNEIITGMETEMLGVEQTPRILTYPT